MKRRKPMGVSQKELMEKFYKEAKLVMKRSQTAGQYMRNFNFLIENNFLKINKPRDSKLYFWKQSLKEFKPIPTCNSFVKKKMKLSLAKSKESSLAGRNDLNKIFQKLLRQNEQQREVRTEKMKLVSFSNQESFRKCLEENDRGRVTKQVKVGLTRKSSSKCPSSGPSSAAHAPHPRGPPMSSKCAPRSN